jgi:hypothetical protein
MIATLPVAFVLLAPIALLHPAYASSEDQVRLQLLELCGEEDIPAEECSEIEILKKQSTGKQLPLSDEERKRLEEQQNQANNSMYMIGIGSAIAGVVVFLTLRKRKNQ